MKSLLVLLSVWSLPGLGMQPGRCIFPEIGEGVGIEISEKEWRERYQLPESLAPALAAASPDIQMAFLQFKHTGRFKFEEMQNIVQNADPALVIAFLDQVRASLAWSQPIVTPEELLQLCANPRAQESRNLLPGLFRWSANGIIAAGKAAPLDLEKAVAATKVLSDSTNHLLWETARDLQEFLSEKKSFLEDPNEQVSRYLILDDVYDQNVRLKITSFRHRRELIVEDMAGKVLFTAGEAQLRENNSSTVRVLRLKFPEAGVPNPSADPVVRQFMADLLAMNLLVNRLNYVPAHGSMVEYRVPHPTQGPSTFLTGLARLRHTP